MDWIKDRVLERTSLDGVLLIVLGIVILIAGPFAKFAASVALLYCGWSLWKSE